MSDAVTRGMFDALVRRAGGVDAVAAVMESRYGHGSKGTISKMCHGQAGITRDAIIAVEDFVGAWPITTRDYERIARERVAAGDIRDLAAQSALAAGVAHAALIRAMTESSDGGDAITRAEAVAIIAAVQDMRALADQIMALAEKVPS